MPFYFSNLILQFAFLLNKQLTKLKLFGPQIRL